MSGRYASEDEILAAESPTVVWGDFPAKLRVLADDYDRQALVLPTFSHDAGRFEGLAGGLRIAAALLENESESS